MSVNSHALVSHTVDRSVASAMLVDRKAEERETALLQSH